MEQNELERKLYMKTRNRSARSDTDIIMIEDIIGVFKFGTDVMMYAISSSSENELILSSVLEGTYEAISGMLRYVVVMDRHNHNSSKYSHLV